MIQEFQVVQVGADVEITPKSHHVVAPPVFLTSKECEFGHHIISVKDMKSRLLGVDSR